MYYRITHSGKTVGEIFLTYHPEIAFKAYVLSPSIDSSRVDDIDSGLSWIAEKAGVDKGELVLKAVEDWSQVVLEDSPWTR